MKHIAALIIGATLSGSVLAEPTNAPQSSHDKVTIQTNKLSVGVGLNHNRIDYSSLGGSDLKASGFQLFAGYELGNKKGFDLSAEAGLINSKNFKNTNTDLDGIWVAGVVLKELPEIHNKLAGLVRIGYGINGDDGLLMGFGAQLRLHPKAVIRLEYLNKDVSQSYQVNGVYQF